MHLSAGTACAHIFCCSILLAFWFTTPVATATDAAMAWQQLGQRWQQATVAYAHAKGSVIMLSAGGEFDECTRRRYFLSSSNPVASEPVI